MYLYILYIIYKNIQDDYKNYSKGCQMKYIFVIIS